MKKAVHIQTKEKTKPTSYRLPKKLLADLETEAMQQGVSTNVLVKQILEKYVAWDRYSDKIGMIPVPTGIMQSLGDQLEGQDINKVIEILKPIIKNNVMFLKGKYDLKRCIETLEDYMRASGMNSDHRTEGELHHFIIQHDLGMSWSLFTKQLLEEIIHEFLPDKKIKSQTTESTVITTVALGSDFDEHSY